MAGLGKMDLSLELDELFRMLRQEAENPTMVPDGQSPPTFADRLALFRDGVRWAAVKARVDIDNEPDLFSQSRGRLDRAGRGGSRRAKAAPDTGDTAGSPAATNGSAASD